MRSENPIVRQNTKATLDSIVNVLQYLVTSFDRFDVDYDDFDDDTLLSTSDMSGLCCLVNCVKVAAEVCFAQYCAETRDEKDK
jgi:hypothetical protein